MSAREAGFSLLELLVALVVLGLLMTGLTAGTRFGFSAWGMQARLGAGAADLDAVDRTLRHLIAEARPAPDRVVPAMLGTAASLAFTTALPAPSDGPAGEADIRLRTDAAHRLVMDWMPHLHATWIGPPRKPQEEVLADGVDGVDLSYLGPTGWVTAWNAPVLPALVRLRIRFPRGDARHWPDLVAAPLRDGR